MEATNASETVDIKVHYTYNGTQRCSLIDCAYPKLYEMCFEEFADYLHEEVPQLKRLDKVKSLTFLDDEDTYVDLTPRNFHRFVRLACVGKSEVPKVNIKVLEGSSPAPKCCSYRDTRDGSSLSRKTLDYEELVKVTYRSPIEIDLDLKRKELHFKETELALVQSKYDDLLKKYNPMLHNHGTKPLCNRCHLRLGHNKNR